MLVAVGAGGRRYTAREDLPEVPRCPDCGAQVVARSSPRRVPHFAHLPHQRCNTPAARAARRRAAARERRRLRTQRSVRDLEAAGQLGLFDLPAPTP